MYFKDIIKLISKRGEFFADSSLPSSERQEIEDQLLQKEIDLGAQIRFQRDIDGRL